MKLMLWRAAFPVHVVKHICCRPVGSPQCLCYKDTLAWTVASIPPSRPTDNYIRSDSETASTSILANLIKAFPIMCQSTSWWAWTLDILLRPMRRPQPRLKAGSTLLRIFGPQSQKHKKLFCSIMWVLQKVMKGSTGITWWLVATHNTGVSEHGRQL